MVSSYLGHDFFARYKLITMLEQKSSDLIFEDAAKLDKKYDRTK